jgi:hypothetical protein
MKTFLYMLKGWSHLQRICHDLISLPYQCEGRSKHRENLVYVDTSSPECKAES